MRIPFTPRLLSSCIATAFIAFSAPSSAIPMFTIDGKFVLGSTLPSLAAPIPADLSAVPVIPTPTPIGPSSAGIDLYYFEENPATLDNIFFHTYGLSNTSTYFGARVSGTGTFYGTTSSALTDTIINSTNAAQSYSLAFFVDDGNVFIDAAAGDGFAHLVLDIKRNGVSVAKSDTQITATGGTTSCVETSAGALSDYTSCNSPSASNVAGASGEYIVDFGVLNPGESFTLNYDIIATVAQEYNGATCDNGGGGGPYGEQFFNETGYGEFPVQAVTEIGYGCFGDSAIARSGDPFDGFVADDPLNPGAFIPGAPFNYRINAAGVGSVPEPDSLALGMIGAVGMYLRRKRSK